MNLTQIGKIARREFLARVRNRAFIIITVMVPAFMAVYIVVVQQLSNAAGPDEIRVAVVDVGTGRGASLAARIREIERPRVTVTEVTTVGEEPAAREPFNAAVRERRIDAYVLIAPGGADAAAPTSRSGATIDPDESTDDGFPQLRYYAREAGNPAFRRELSAALQSLVVGDLLAGTGVDAEAVRRAQRLSVEAVRVSDRGEGETGFETALGATVVMATLLYIAVLINGQGMATAIVEEKSSRLIEVILGAVTATEFMMGKILGVLGSGLTQLGVWLAVVVAVAVQGLPALIVGSEATGFDLGSVVTVSTIFYFAVFFALGYLLYSVLFAVIASTCTSTEELGQSMFLGVMPMVFAFVIAVSTLQNPSGAVARVSSLFPFFTPLVMLARVNILMPPLWEVWLGIVLLAAASVGLAWIAAKVFRYTLLMTGKRPSLPELIRVVLAN